MVGFLLFLLPPLIIGLPDADRMRMLLMAGKRYDEDSVHISSLDQHLQAEELTIRIDQWLTDVGRILDDFSVEDLQQQHIADLHREIKRATRRIDRVRQRLKSIVDSNERRYQTSVYKNGSVGRPQLSLQPQQLSMLHHQGFSWAAIARMLGVSESTVWRRLRQFHINSRDRYTNMSDEALDCLVREIKSGLPEAAGVVTVRSHIRARGIHLSNAHQRVHQSLTRLEPLATTRRWNAPVTRRSYWVPGPGSLWHLDGNHKLIKWGIVIHGCIDGYSRLVAFCYASDNNFAQTVGLLFVQAGEQLGYPSRIRTDCGGENNIAGAIMESIRGQGRGSWLRGPSVHNQRIERLWRDLRGSCSNLYIDLFNQLEDDGQLSVFNNIHLFALHYVFLPRVNVALANFRAAYNEHSLRTMGNRTPRQLYMSGVLANYNSHYVQIRDIIDQTPAHVNLEEFGLQGNIPDDVEEPVVNIPRPTLGLSNFGYGELIAGLQQLIPNVTADCPDHGQGFYLQVRAFIDAFMVNNS